MRVSNLVHRTTGHFWQERSQLTSVVIKEAYVSILVCCDCEGKSGVAYDFVDLS